MNQKPGTVRLFGKLICASQQDIEVVQQYMPEHIRQIKTEPGYLAFEVMQTDDSLVWCVE